MKNIVRTKPPLNTIIKFFVSISTIETANQHRTVEPLSINHSWTQVNTDFLSTDYADSGMIYHEGIEVIEGCQWPQVDFVGGMTAACEISLGSLQYYSINSRFLCDFFKPEQRN